MMFPHVYELKRTCCVSAKIGTMGNVYYRLGDFGREILAQDALNRGDKSIFVISVSNLVRWHALLSPSLKNFSGRVFFSLGFFSLFFVFVFFCLFFRKNKQTTVL